MTETTYLTAEQITRIGANHGADALFLARLGYPYAGDKEQWASFSEAFGLDSDGTAQMAFLVGWSIGWSGL